MIRRLRGQPCARPLLRTFAFLTAMLLALCAQLATARADVLPSIELEIELDPVTRRLDVEALVRPASTDFRFVLHESLEIRDASADGQALPVAPAGREGALRGWRISMPHAAPLRLRYGGTLPALERSLDHRDVLRRLAPMASVEGSFLPAGSAWYPQPGPLFSYRLALAVPAAQRALVAGRLVAETLPAGDAGHYHARFEFPDAADGIDLMVGPWTVRERLVPRVGTTPLRLRTYFPADLDAIDGLADAYLTDSGRYIERYSGEIGPYPFDSFSVVASPLPTGFGMPTLTYIGAEVLKLPFIRATSLGHEVLHNWWGNGVFVDYPSGNWAEGLTTFMADHAYKEDESAAAARAMRLGWLRDFAAVPAADQQTLAAFRSRTHGAAAAVGYGKAAMLFVMLREEIGADAFDRGIRDFWARHRFGIAGWQDLRAAFEAASNRDLTSFFDQWLTRRGGPAPRIEQARARTHAGRTQLNLTLSQETPPYALKLPLELVYADRRERVHAELRHARQQLTLDLDAAPASVRVDPDLRLWRVLAPDQLPPILRQWITAPTPRLAIAQAPGQDEAAHRIADAATALAKRFFERTAQPGRLEALDRAPAPMLLVGRHAAVDAALARAGLPPRPASLGLRGSAQVWTVIRKHGTPLAVVSATDEAALQALLRPLPHYGAQSWLVFDGSRALERGVWEAADDGVEISRD